MYIEKLTKKDIEELEKVVMGCDCFDRKQTQIYIDSNPNLYVTFWEEIPPDFPLETYLFVKDKSVNSVCAAKMEEDTEGRDVSLIIELLVL